MAFCKLPAGVRDTFGTECRWLETLRKRLTRAFEAAGYEPVRSAAVEYYDTYASVRNAVAQERMFKFTDGDGKLLVLRPDATLSIARIAATRFPRERVRFYYFADKWDARETGGLREREVFQAGVERFGEQGAYSDAQTIAFAVECLKQAGLKNFIVDIGHAGYLKGILEECGLSRAAAEEVRAHVYGKDTLSAELALKKAGADAKTVNEVLALPALFGGAEVLAKADALTQAASARAAVAHLREVYALLSDMGYADYLRFDMGAVKSLSYYSGIVFSGLAKNTGAPVLSGGRYDDLAGDFGKSIPAVGFAIGFKRLMLALERQGGVPDSEEESVTVVCEKGAEGRAYAEFLRLMREGKRVSLSADYAARGQIPTGKDVIFVSKEDAP